MPKVKRALRVDVGADADEQHPERIIATAFRSEPWASTTGATRPRIISEKYSAGPEHESEVGERPGEGRDQERRDRAGEEGADRGEAERDPARPWRAIWWPSRR